MESDCTGIGNSISYHRHYYLGCLQIDSKHFLGLSLFAYGVKCLLV
jgi:hypothetical protein